jgi:hypothetical protein
MDTRRSGSLTRWRREAVRRIMAPRNLSPRRPARRPQPAPRSTRHPSSPRGSRRDRAARSAGLACCTSSRPFHPVVAHHDRPAANPANSLATVAPPRARQSPSRGRQPLGHPAPARSSGTGSTVRITGAGPISPLDTAPTRSANATKSPSTRRRRRIEFNTALCRSCARQKALIRLVRRRPQQP